MVDTPTAPSRGHVSGKRYPLPPSWRESPQQALGRPATRIPRRLYVSHEPQASPSGFFSLVFHGAKIIHWRGLSRLKLAALIGAKKTDPAFFCPEALTVPSIPMDFTSWRKTRKNRTAPEVGAHGRARRACVPRWPRPFKGPAQGLSYPPGRPKATEQPQPLQEETSCEFLSIQTKFKTL